MSLSFTLEKFMNAKGMKYQAELASYWNVHPSTISGWIHSQRNPKPDIVAEICATLNLAPGQVHRYYKAFDCLMKGKPRH